MCRWVALYRNTLYNHFKRNVVTLCRYIFNPPFVLMLVLGLQAVAITKHVLQVRFVYDLCRFVICEHLH